MSSYILVVRSPDWQTEVTTQGLPDDVEVINIDLGSNYDIDSNTLYDADLEALEDDREHYDKLVSEMPDGPAQQQLAGVVQRIEERIAQIRRAYDMPYETDGFTVFGPVRVSFDFIGEGVSGDYNPQNPDDVELLRIDCNVTTASGYGGEPTDDPDWVYPEQGSICTEVPHATPLPKQRELLEVAARYLRWMVESDGSVKKAMDHLSRLNADDTDESFMARVTP